MWLVHHEVRRNITGVRITFGKPTSGQYWLFYFIFGRLLITFIEYHAHLPLDSNEGLIDAYDEALLSHAASEELISA